MYEALYATAIEQERAPAGRSLANPNGCSGLPPRGCARRLAIDTARVRWPLTDDQTTHLIIGLMIAAGVVGAIASVRSSRLR